MPPLPLLQHMALGMLWPSRHRRLRNLLLLLLRSTSLGLGVGGASVWDAVNGGGGGALGGLGPGAPGPREMLAQLARLLYASCALPLAVSSALLPLPFG